jgi:hypothetical protein
MPCRPVQVEYGEEPDRDAHDFAVSLDHVRERARLGPEEGLGECGHRVLYGIRLAFVHSERMDAGQDAGSSPGRAARRIAPSGRVREVTRRGYPGGAMVRHSAPGDRYADLNTARGRSRTPTRRRVWRNDMTTGPEPGWYDDGHGSSGGGTAPAGRSTSSTWATATSNCMRAPAPAGAAAGWYDDGRGRQRWWDGARWTDAARFSGTEDSFAGLVVDGRWIHFGALSQPVSGVTAASVESGAELLRRGRLGKPATARALYGPAGLITPRLLSRSVVGTANYVLVDVAGQLWLAGVPAGRMPQHGSSCRGSTPRRSTIATAEQAVSIWMRLDRHQGKGGFTRRRRNHEETSDGQARYDGSRSTSPSPRSWGECARVTPGPACNYPTQRRSSAREVW